MSDGILLVDKAGGWTSHDVVARARRLLGTRRVGHAGTLDPMATGLLVLGVDRGTKLLTHLVGLDKVYRATIRLGQATITDDAEGEVTATAAPEAIAAVDEARIRQTIARHLTGEIMQVPSAVSAIRVDGVRSYARVRGGEAVALAPRPVTVHAFEVHAVRTGPGVVDVDATVHCGSGTYVRALARDLGRLLDVGGHLTALRREQVGPFRAAEAVRLPGREVPVESVPRPRLLTLAEAATRVFPVRELADAEADDLRHGRAFTASGRDGVVAAVDAAGRLVGLVCDRGGRARSVFLAQTPGAAETPDTTRGTR